MLSCSGVDIFVALTEALQFLQNKKDRRMNVVVTMRLQLIDCEIAIYCEITGIIQVKRNSDVRADQLR